jgi:alpha-L-glutamate ligase-like protein
MLSRWRALRQRGVLGMNDRNGSFILPNNPRKHYPRVDDKLLTKRLAQAAGIPIPRLLGVVSEYHELRDVPAMLDHLQPFVIKPARGAQGNGIVVIVEAAKGRYRRANGTFLDDAEVQEHISSILSGVFSLRGDWDSAIIEEMIVIHPAFSPIALQGVPDIRVVVYRGLPVMAMCRLPTSLSSGRANLHQGAIGMGIDIASGRSVHAMLRNRTITTHMDTGHDLVGFTVPHWNEVLSLAARASDVSGLGYLGVDVVVDAAHGPVLLELNARPGLAIQLANMEGLLPRLRRADSIPVATLSTWEDRCRVARELFERSPV